MKTVLITGDASIGTNAFSGCADLTSIHILGNVTSIGNNAFRFCTGLTDITISKSVALIDSSAFDKCTSLTDVYYTGTEQEWGAMVVQYGNDALSSATIHYDFVPEE